jgi:hypothetical protein
VCNLLLLNNDLFREHFHGVDSLCILLANLEDLSKSTLADESQNLKVLWSVNSLVGLLEAKSELDLAGNIVSFAFSRLQFEPGFVGCVVILKVGAETDMTDKSFLILLVVHRNIQLRLVTNNITAASLA